MKGSYLGFLIFVSLLVIFFVIPDPEGLQKPFRIFLAVTFVAVYTDQLVKREIPFKTLIPVIGAVILLIIMLRRGTIQTSFVNAALCLFGIIGFNSIKFDLTEIRRTNLVYIHTLCLISIVIQFLIFSSKDGRPTLAYEINLSAAYLFLFFLFSDVLDLKYGKILIIFLSLITLSRLLVFCIIIFYLVRFLKPRFRVWLSKVNVSVILIASYVLISVFSIWYVANVKRELSYDSSISRLTKLNDQSNEWRFFSNTLVIGQIYKSPLDPTTLFGYGKVENFIRANKDSMVMPHNELFDSIIEFGIISVIFFSIFTVSVYQKFTTFSNLEFFVPVLFYTLILWVRFLLIPSFEMIFILFLMYIVSQKNQKQAVSVSNG